MEYGNQLVTMLCRREMWNELMEEADEEIKS